MRDRILREIEDNADLPALPEIVLRLQAVLRDPDARVPIVAEIIELDPVLAGKVLRLSNSTFYNRSARRITSLPLAVTRLGFKVISHLVYSLKLTGLFGECTSINARDFWRHSLAVAVFTQALSVRGQAHSEAQDIAYLSGLMHDIGIAVFANVIPEEYSRFMHDSCAIEKPLHVQEMERFGIDHQEVGAHFIARRWSIDERVTAGVRAHHHPFHDDPEIRKGVQLVNIANGICNNQGITNGVPCYTEIFRDTAWDELGFSLSDVDRILEDVNQSLTQAEEIMHMG